jgi:hypothetical protein
MAYAYRDSTPLSLQIPTSADPAKSRRAHLFDAYVEKRLDSSTSQYTAAQTRHYLAWLAGKMVELKRSVFYIERLQPGWLEMPRKKRLYRLIVITVLGLGVGLGVGLIGGLMVGLVVLLGAGQTFWLVLVMGVMLVFGPTYGLVLGLVWGLGDIKIADTLRWRFSWRRLPFGLAGWGETEESVTTRSYPNQGIYRSLRNAIQAWSVLGLAGGLAIGLAGGLAGGLAIGLAGGLAGGLAVGLVGGLRNGGAAVVKHGILRLFLARSGAAPLNYARFLDYCASINLLRKVGGGYIFVHRYLLEYFAE